ncbi:MAG: hypothetical protein ACKV2T_40195 [Kofleriaceae bacterium]
MARRPGHDSGHAGFDWGDYVEWLTSTAGSLAAVADRLCAARGYKEDVGSIERALRRLRTRGTHGGGTWGTRAIALFGLPSAIDARVRQLGQYHARLAELPVSMCEDLIRVWDKPPITESRAGRAWLAVARASIAVRLAKLDDAIAILDRARADLSSASAGPTSATSSATSTSATPTSATSTRAISTSATSTSATSSPGVIAVPLAARIEAILIRGYVASRTNLAAVPGLLDEAARLIDAVDDAYDRACLLARLADHRAYELNQRGEHEAAEAVYRAMRDEGPTFARTRRANGIAYARWLRGEPDAADFARAAIEHAGDGGHLRGRAMALRNYARIVNDADAQTRAVAIAQHLEDETLLGRFRR